MTHDPFAHLHVEDYAQRYARHRVDAAQRVFVADRPRVSLGGDWAFVPDLFDEGLRQRWYRDPPGEPTRFERPRDHDWNEERTATVPSCWNLQVPELFHFEGSCWYSRTIARPPMADGERLILRIGAANYTCRVFLDGACLAEHLGGSTPFYLELPAPPTDNDHRLHLQVENRRERGRVPMHHIDWFNYGGPHREVDLLVVPATYVRDFRIGLLPSGEAFATVALSAPVDTEATLRVPTLGLERTLEVIAGNGSLRFSLDAERWSPDTPILYEVELEIGDERLRDRVGFRTLEVRERQLLLNGRPLWLRGVCCHEDDLDTGRVTSDADIRRRFDHVRALGANAIRLTHYPHHERVAQLADEVGLLLIEEIPVYWAIDFENPATLADASNQLRELIARDANRASVILWSIGNENADTDARLGFMRELARVAREADDSRPITAACLIDREHFEIRDRLAAHLDVIGVNEYFGWYERDFADLDRLLANSNPDKPVIIAETGADASTGLIGAAGELFGEAHQAAVLKRQIITAERTPWIIGIFPWLLYDYRTERRQTRLQRGWSLKGLIDRDKRTRKLGFEAVRAAYGRIVQRRG